MSDSACLFFPPVFLVILQQVQARFPGFLCSPHTVFPGFDEHIKVCDLVSHRVADLPATKLVVRSSWEAFPLACLARVGLSWGRNEWWVGWIFFLSMKNSKKMGLYEGLLLMQSSGRCAP